MGVCLSTEGRVVCLYEGLHLRGLHPGDGGLHPVGGGPGDLGRLDERISYWNAFLFCVKGLFTLTVKVRCFPYR